MVRALPDSSLDDDDDMQWEAADADYAGGAGAAAAAADGGGYFAAREPLDLAGSPPLSWEDRHELQGAGPCLGGCGGPPCGLRTGVGGQARAPAGLPRSPQAAGRRFRLKSCFMMPL